MNKLATGLRIIIQGDGVSSRWFKKHFFTTAFIILACVLAIAQRFQCISSENYIESLIRQIEVMDTEKQKEISTYMSLTRESAMIHLVDSLRLGLTIPDEHAKTVIYKSNE